MHSIEGLYFDKLFPQSFMIPYYFTFTLNCKALDYVDSEFKQKYGEKSPDMIIFVGKQVQI